MSNGKIKINELPEAALAKDSDIFILENDATTQKISLGSLINYVKEHEEIADYFVKQSAIDSENGVAPLDSNGKIPSANLPFGTTENTVYDGALGQALSDNFSLHTTDTANPHDVTKAQVGLSDVDNTADTVKPVSAPQQKAIDTAYASSNAYTDTKIAELIDGAPSTLDTLGEIARALQEGGGINDALDAAIGTKASQAELDSHTGNDTMHITASERTKWNSKMGSTEDACNTTVTFSEASDLSNINSGEKTGSMMGKISKAVSTLISHIPSKATTTTFGHVKLSDTYLNTVADGNTASGVGASQKALAEAYSALNSSLTDSLGGITFGVDDDGNYGYIKAGADTVTPFKSTKELKLYGGSNITYVFLLAGIDYAEYKVESNGGYLNSSRVIFFEVPALDSPISITTFVNNGADRLGYCFREDSTISQIDGSATWVRVPFSLNIPYKFTLREIAEQYPTAIHGSTLGFGLYQYAAANLGNNQLNSIITW